MIAEIEDGTLVPGPRPSDDGLTGWLGVSRTPVREAIARLVVEGFLEMAANHHTNVSSLFSAEYGYGYDFLAGLHETALDRADAVDACVRDEAVSQATKAAGGFKRHQLAAYRELLDSFGVLTVGLENPLCTDA